MPIVNGIFSAPFTGTLEPFIPMRRVFTRACLEGAIPIYAITSKEMMLIVQPSSINTW
jgi:hypothetical protein